MFNTEGISGPCLSAKTKFLSVNRTQCRMLLAFSLDITP
jgi:hypothetical protein